MAARPPRPIADIRGLAHRCEGLLQVRREAHMKAIIPIMMLIGSLNAAPAMAKPCTVASVVGTWSLASIKAAEPGVEEFYKRVPHEIMRFTADGNFMYLASTRPLESSDAEQQLDAADARDGTRYAYSIDRSGRMMILRQETPFQVFQCDIADADNVKNDVRTGDMILSNRPGAPMLRRVQRKLR